MLQIVNEKDSGDATGLLQCCSRRLYPASISLMFLHNIFQPSLCGAVIFPLLSSAFLAAQMRHASALATFFLPTLFNTLYTYNKQSHASDETFN